MSSERLVRFIVEVRERPGTALLDDAVACRGVIVDLIKIEDMDAAVTHGIASVDEPIAFLGDPKRHVSQPAFCTLPLSNQLDRLANYASVHRNA